MGKYQCGQCGEFQEQDFATGYKAGLEHVLGWIKQRRAELQMQGRGTLDYESAVLQGQVEKMLRELEAGEEEEK